VYDLPLYDDFLFFITKFQKWGAGRWVIVIIPLSTTLAKPCPRLLLVIQSSRKKDESNIRLSDHHCAQQFSYQKTSMKSHQAVSVLCVNIFPNVLAKPPQRHQVSACLVIPSYTHKTQYIIKQYGSNCLVGITEVWGFLH